jgi:hypothetical protein
LKTVEHLVKDAESINWKVCAYVEEELERYLENTIDSKKCRRLVFLYFFMID